MQGRCHLLHPLLRPQRHVPKCRHGQELNGQYLLPCGGQPKCHRRPADDPGICSPAAGRRQNGPRIIAATEVLRNRVRLFACIDTLEYLYKGGRISQTVYKLGTLANIKPIITIELDGSIGIPAKAMGMRKGMDYLCKQAQAHPADPEYPFYVMYTNNRSVAQALASKLATYGISVSEDRIIQVGAAIGSHIGPDACGLVYIAK